MPSNTIKYKSNLFQQEVTLTVDENLNKLKGKVLAPKKLAAANRSLKKLRALYQNNCQSFSLPL